MLKKSALSISGSELQLRAQEAIRYLVANVPDSRLEMIATQGSGTWDFEARLAIGSSAKRLLCEAKSRAWPNELHAVAHRLQAAVRQNLPDRCVPVFIAPYLSPQAIEFCSEHGLSWTDLAGNGELKIEGAYVRVIGKTNSFKTSRGTTSLYSPKSARIVHALLLEPKRKWKTDELAHASGASLGQVSSVKAALQAMNWIEAGYGSTSLTEPRKLLDDWALHYRPGRQTVRFFTLDTPSKLEASVADTIPVYAFTEFSAAERYAPYTRHQRVAFYVPTWTEADAAAVRLKGGDGAANVTVYVAGEALDFVEEVGGTRCVSPILTYLDLKQLSGRGQDAADHLLETVIHPRWG